MRIKGNNKTFRCLKEGDVILITNYENECSGYASFIKMDISRDSVVFRYKYFDRENVTRLAFRIEDIDSQFMDRRTVKGKNHTILIK